MNTNFELWDVVLFVSLLAGIGTALWVGLQVRGDFSVHVYYVLMYVSYLFLLELTSPFDLRLGPRWWLNFTIVTGFLGWIISLAAVFLP